MLATLSYRVFAITSLYLLLSHHESSCWKGHINHSALKRIQPRPCQSPQSTPSVDGCKTSAMTFATTRGLAALLQRYTDHDLSLSSLLSHTPSYTNTMSLLEAIRTSDGSPIPAQLIDQLPNIKIVNGKPTVPLENFKAIEHRHGIYMQNRGEQEFGVRVRGQGYCGEGLPECRRRRTNECVGSRDPRAATGTHPRAGDRIVRKPKRQHGQPRGQHALHQSRRSRRRTMDYPFCIDANRSD